MSRWPCTTLGEVIEILDAKRRPVNSDERSLRLGDVPYYGANGQQGWIDTPLFDEPLILLAEDGGNFDDFASRPIAYRIDGPSWVNNHAHILRARPVVDQRFLFWSLVHRDIRRFISGGTRTKLTQAELRSIEIDLPPVDEQRQIAEVLDALDDEIRTGKELVSKLHLLSVGLADRLLPGGGDDELPSGWWLSSVGEVYEIQAGITLGPHRVPGRNATGYLRVANVQRSVIDLGDIARLHASPVERAKYGLRSGDLLVVEGHADVNQIGRCARVPEEAEGLVYQNHLFRLRSTQLNQVFGEAWLNSKYARQYWRRTCSSSSGLNTINSKQLRAMRVVVPPPQEQERIAAVLAGMAARIESEQQALDKLVLQKAGLLADLLSGRVRVPAGAAS